MQMPTKAYGTNEKDRTLLSALNRLGPSSVKKLNVNLPNEVTGTVKDLDYSLRSLCRRGFVQSEVVTMYGREVRRYTPTEKGKKAIGVQSQKPAPKPAKPASLRRKAPEEKTESTPKTEKTRDTDFTEFSRSVARRFAQDLEDALVKDVQTVLRGASLSIVIEDSTGVKTGPQVSIDLSLAEFVRQMPEAGRKLVAKLASSMSEEMLRKVRKA